MNRFWQPVIKPCLEAINAKYIVEIGSDYGVGTKNLITYCKENNGQVVSIDPVPKYEVEELVTESEGVFKLYQDLSLNRLPLLKDYDAILVDGDHNWYTVYNELKIIAKTFKGQTLPLIFVHDIGWPYARRDLYYNPDNIPVGYRQAYAKKGMLQGEPNLVEEGGINAHLNNAIYENNPQNGVLSAVEDALEFIAREELELVSLPGLFGLGIIVSRGTHDAVIEYLKQNNVYQEVLMVVEQERVKGEIDKAAAKKSLTQKNQIIQERNTKIDTLNEKCELLTQTHSTEIINIKKELNSTYQTIENDKADIESLQQELEDRDAHILEIVELQETYIQKIRDMESEIKIQCEYYSELESKYIDSIEETEYLQGIIQKSENHIIQLKELIQEQETLANKLKREITNKNKRVEKLSKDVMIHLNSVRYKIGDAVVKSSESMGEAVKLPRRLYHLFKQGKENQHIRDDIQPNAQIIQITEKDSSKVSDKKEKANSAVVIEPIPDEEVKVCTKHFNYISFEKKLKKLKDESINIIVPIYNAYEEVEECIKSVLDNTQFPYKLILIDDCSPDPRIKVLLKEYEGRESIEILYNEKNMGYVSTINKGITYVGTGDVVLLNSDTKVTKNWLLQLVIAAIQDPKVGTVTPFSNAAGAFSIPVMGENKDLPEGITLERMTEIVGYNAQCAYVEVPTGNGFCMYVKRALIDDIGLFDDETFRMGYGEENDFCMRALKKGWKNIIDDKTYIYHKRSASFSDNKKVLIAENRKKLDQKHPEYKHKISVFKENKQLIQIREKLGNIIDDTAKHVKINEARTNILYVLHEAGGGTPNTNKDLMKNVGEQDYNTFVLTSDGSKLKLWVYEDEDMLFLREWKMHSKWELDTFTNPEFKNIYFDILYGLNIGILHIRHLLKHSFDIVGIAKKLNISVAMSFHDFYYVCPSIHLLDEEGKYCEAICQKGKNNCKFSPFMKIQGNCVEWVNNVWRMEVAKLLDQCDVFITTSEYTKQIYTKTYNILNQKDFRIIEHGRDFDYNQLNVKNYYDKKSKIRILLPGNIGFNKGSKFVSDLIEYDKDKQLEIHLIGKHDKNLQGNFVNHGEYERDEFLGLVKSIKPHFVAIFSLWPETYCHTLSEAWSCGVPALVSDMGTLHDRCENGGAVLVDCLDVAGTHKRIVDAYEQDVYKKLCDEVTHIEMRTTEQMSDEYLAIYKLLK